jgi:HEAT repeat protein
VGREALDEVLNEKSAFLTDAGDADDPAQTAEVRELASDLKESADPDKRAHAAIKLGQLGDAAGVPALVQALRNDGADQVRTFSAVALGMIGSRDAVRPLIEVINAQVTSRFETPQDFSYGGFQLIRTLQREIDPEPEDWLGQDPIAAQIWALGRIGSPGACSALVERLADGDPGIRWFAAWALGKIGDQRVVPTLTELIDDAVDDVSWIAIWALGRMNSTEAVPRLVTAASDPNPSIRRIAIWALGRSGHLRGREVALDALTDPERGVRQVASWALSQIEPELAQSA